MGMKEQIVSMAHEKGILKAADLETAGISRNYLYSLCRENILVKVSPGMYGLAENEDITEYQSLIEVTNKIPNAVINLLSALSFHGITTQIPHEVWVAVPRNTRRPKFEFLSVNYSTLTDNSYRYGIESHDVGTAKLNVYSVAKTIADCYKFRNSVGVDVFLEALKFAWVRQMVTMDQLVQAAEVNRVLKGIRPYLEAIV